MCSGKFFQRHDWDKWKEIHRLEQQVRDINGWHIIGYIVIQERVCKRCGRIQTCRG